jgi:adenosylhomocysteine nucleosidase
MPKIAIVVALEREVRGLIRRCSRVVREYDGRKFVFYEHNELVLVCGGIGIEAARWAAEAVIALYHPAQVQSVGFAGALDRSLHVGDIFVPSAVIDARDGSRIFMAGIDSRKALVTFASVAGVHQKRHLADAYGANAVDMEASGVAAAAVAHGIEFASVKAISDELDFEMPGMDRFIDARGRFRTVAFVAFLALRPWLWPRVAVLDRNSRKAARALSSHLERLVREQKEPVEANIT